MSPSEQNTSSPNPSFLDAQQLVKAYHGRTVVDRVSIRLNCGQVVGLLGPNGAGKTTCFSLMTGLVKPDGGSIFLDDQDITTLPMYVKSRLGIRYLPQESSIFRGLSVEQNIMAILEILEPDRDKREAQLQALLDEFSLEKMRKALSFGLSGGERRRVELARALVGNPFFLFLDEPLAGIDPKAVGDLRSLILHLKERNIGVLITDHNVRDILSIVDYAYILAEGQVLSEGTPEYVTNNELVKATYLGDTFKLH